MNTFDKVIFVCNGNTCRSPMAATVMANLKQDIISESRGMVVLFPEPYNPKAVAVAAKHNMIIPNNSAKQLLNEDFGNDTLVLAMDSSMKQKIYDEYSEAINVYTLSEYAGEPEQEIKDPYGKGIEEYNVCFELIYRLVGNVAEYLDGLSEEKEDKGEEQ